MTAPKMLCLPLILCLAPARVSAARLTPPPPAFFLGHRTATSARIFASPVFREAYLGRAKEVIEAMQQGLPLKLPIVSCMAGVELVDEAFGLPLDPCCGEAPLELTYRQMARAAATRDVLAWFARRGVHAVNSSKRKKP